MDCGGVPSLLLMWVTKDGYPGRKIAYCSSPDRRPNALYRTFMLQLRKLYEGP
ncbi:MAG: hypothetical protein GXY73_11920 [Methanothrix sp.]|nr:hypothetical protein [Methanothrix sp.]